MSGEADDMLAMLDNFLPLREMWRGMVANLVDDGFTDEEARLLVVNVLTGYRWGTEATDDDETDGSA